MRVGFVANPSSHRFDRRPFYKAFLTAMREFGAEEIAINVDAETLADTVAAYDQVIVAGGDGTVNVLLPALITSKTPFLPFPAGTANDLATRVGHTVSLDKLRTALEANKRSPLSLGTIGGRPFAIYAAIGLGAQASAWRARHRKSLALVRNISPTAAGPVATVAAILGGHIGLEGCRLDEASERTLVGMGWSPQQSFSGVYVFALDHWNRKIRVGQEQGLHRNVLSFVFVVRSSRLTLLKSFAAIPMFGDLTRSLPGLFYLEAARATIAHLQGPGLRAYVDGEPAVEIGQTEICSLPAAVEVILPAA